MKVWLDFFQTAKYLSLLGIYHKHECVSNPQIRNDKEIHAILTRPFPCDTNI
jgi:hypothetical protein